MLLQALLHQLSPAPVSENNHHLGMHKVPNLVSQGAWAIHIQQLLQTHPTVVLFMETRQEIEQMLRFLSAMGVEDCVYYPTPNLSPYEWTGDERMNSHQRHAIRYRLLNTPNPPRCILTTYKAATHLMMDNITWYQSTLTLYPGDVMSPPEMVQHLIHMGYEPVSWVAEHGQFTRRGSVLDVYPVGCSEVVRIEWFDDEIEHVFTYHLNDNLSKPQKQKYVTIPPAYEWIIPTDSKALKIKLQENHRGNYITYLQHMEYRPELYQIMRFFHPVTTLMGSLPKDSVLLWPEDIWLKCKSYAYKLDGIAEGQNVQPMHYGLDELKALHDEYTQHCLTGPDGSLSPVLLPTLEKTLDKMTERLQNEVKSGHKVTVISPRPERIKAILEDRNCAVSTHAGKWIDGHVQVLSGNLPEGFVYAPDQWLCFSDRELFEEKGHMTKNKRRKRPRAALKLHQLKPQMLVVHEVHGVGRYQGLVQYNTTGETREYLSLHYANEDRLLVPVEQMHRLQIYQGVGGERLKLHKLGGGEWEKAKAKVQKNLIEIAEKLLQTEAERMKAEGISFPEDSHWQREMEEAFPYEETPDQLRAIQESKADMEKDTPMNRLVCGDVGFGKTEVALRSAFKGAISGYQVAFLAPTTILAHQHYQVLKDRFAPYPVRVELLSRYRTGKESDKIFKEIKAGEIDIVVATHRILSKRLSFKNLGLLIIDEEHRFGVNQKEKLKQLQPNVDILTMSATPIPRTLNIALGGLKSLSLIETPPPNRQSIKTEVSAYDDAVIKKAIYNELQRNGQIYYIHNRVKSIHDVGRKIEELAPQARVRVAHGQMSKQELERTMWDFYHHEFDILVCTTIVESGLDISNVNTLIIEEVERLGLAQIHQLRGRVGRSNIQAYAYLLHDAKKPLTKEARQRLTVIQEYSHLGSGYYLSLKDMEIRGIGNIIGPQQHGNIITVGFDTYCQMLEETLSILRGETPDERPFSACVVDLNLSAYIPDEWISEPLEKMRYYRALANAVELDYLETLKKEAEKKFGPMPYQAETLWRISRVRIMGNDLRIEKMSYQNDQIELSFLLPFKHFDKAQQGSPVLRKWEQKQHLLCRKKFGKGNKNLDFIEQALEALLDFEDQYSEDILDVA